MRKPVAVLISDVHYNIQTLQVADAAMRLAITKANELGVPLIVAGDLHDTKANLRGECVNAMLKTFDLCVIKPYVLVGNHDKINEKSEEHSLNFLQNKVTLVNRFRYPKIHTHMHSFALVGYHHDTDELKKHINNFDGRTLIMHQGINGSNSGEYIQDKTALNKEDVAGRRIISGHYHQRQTIELPAGGKWDYIGNPYTLGFGEANDPEKGYQILMSDGSLEFVPTNLRKHVIIQMDGTKAVPYHYNPDDLIWVKVKSNAENLHVFTKERIGKMLNIHWGFRLDIIPTETRVDAEVAEKSLSGGELLDSIIDSLSNTDDDRKERLKETWKLFKE